MRLFCGFHSFAQCFMKIQRTAAVLRILRYCVESFFGFFDLHTWRSININFQGPVRQILADLKQFTPNSRFVNDACQFFYVSYRRRGCS